MSSTAGKEIANCKVELKKNSCLPFHSQNFVFLLGYQSESNDDYDTHEQVQLEPEVFLTGFIPCTQMQDTFPCGEEWVKQYRLHDIFEGIFPLLPHSASMW